MSISKDFQDNFIDLMKRDFGEINKKQAYIAKQLNITYTTFSKMYNYGILPSVQILIRLADFFNVSVEYLLGNTENESIEKAKAPSTFQTRLQELKEEKQIASIFELGERVHIHRNNIAQWLHKNYIPNLDDLILLADFFDVSIDYLLDRTDYKD